MAKNILIGVGIVLAVLLALIVMQPSDFRVVRSASIAALPATVFGLVNDFHKWDAWSPWAKLDPNMKTAFEGAAAGQGSVYRWSGNSDAGEGSMTILESNANERIRVNLEFVRPFESRADVEFQFKPDGAGTRVDWTMSGANDFLSKAFCLFMGGMDKMVGPDFEKGLAQMKSAAEATK